MKPNILVGLKIAELYPDNLVPVAVIDEKTNKWSVALIEVKDGVLLDTIYAIDGYKWENKEDALIEMELLLKDLLKTIKTMSN